MSSFLVIKKNLELSAGTGTKMLVGKQNRAIPAPPSPLPYDSKVEYLESNANEYPFINTNVILLTHDIVQITYQFISQSSVSGQNSNFSSAFGARKSNYSSNAFALFTRFLGLNNFCFCRTGHESTSTIDSTIKSVCVVQDNICTIKQNNNTFSITSNGTLENCICPCLIFSLNTSLNGGVLPDTPPGKARCFNFSIVRDNEKIIDLIPVRVGQVGYMYDKVSGLLFGNQGSGDFVLGDDIAEIEYIGFTGTLWIDTNFTATGGCIMECSYYIPLGTSYNDAYMLIGSHNTAGNSSNGYNRNEIRPYSATEIAFNKCEKYGSIYPSSLAGDFHTLYFNTIGNNRLAKIDGDTVVNETTTYTLAPTNTVKIAYNNYDTAVSPLNGRIAWAKVWNANEELVFDGIPMRKGQIGYLYDKVSGQFFGNSGTGNFVLGDDVEDETTLNNNLLDDEGLISYAVVTTMKKHFDFGISYDVDPVNGQSVSSFLAKFPSGKYDPLSAVPSYAHHRFLGWHTLANDTTNEYAITSGSLKTSSDGVDCFVPTLYGNWQATTSVTLVSQMQDWNPEIGHDCYVGQQYGELPEYAGGSGLQFRYLRMNISKIRSSYATVILLSRVDFLDSNGNMFQWPNGAIVTCTIQGQNSTGASNEYPSRIIDGNTGTKYCSGFWSSNPVPCVLTIDLGVNNVIDITTYSKWRWYTANDASERDPISFTLEASNDDETWIELDSVENANITTTRLAIAYTGDMTKNYDVANDADCRSLGWYTLQRTPDKTATTAGSRITSSSLVTCRPTLYALWLLPSNITFDATTNGGSMQPWSHNYYMTVSYGELPPVDDRLHYYYEGWFTLAIGGTKVTSNTPVPGDTTLYAQWAPSVSVLFDATTNGGLMPLDWISPDYFAGHTYGTLPIPTHPQLTFVGWYLDSESIDENSIVPAEGAILVAQYLALTYTVDISNGDWVLQSPNTNPDLTVYDGVYQSDRYHGSPPGSGCVVKMYINTIGCQTFDIYIRSNGENGWSYAIAVQQDIDPSNYSEAISYALADTNGKATGTTSIDSYTKVTYNLGGGNHRICIAYIHKDSYTVGDDRGYVLIKRVAKPATIIFDPTSNGQMPAGWTPPTYYEGNAYGELPVPTYIGSQTGYLFSGWQDSNGNIITTSSIVPTGGTTLYATFSLIVRVEYIESTGTLWIDTGIIPTEKTSAKMKVYNVLYTGDVIFGYYNGSDSSDWRFFNAGQDIYFDCYSGCITKSNGWQTGLWREFEIGNNYIKDLETGNNIVSGTIQSSFTGTRSITLNNYNNSSFSKNKWAYVKIYENNVLVRDMIPVRLGQVGYMYDQVNGQLFGNQGSGDFVLGNDVVEDDNVIVLSDINAELVAEDHETLIVLEEE